MFITNFDAKKMYLVVGHSKKYTSQAIKEEEKEMQQASINNYMQYKTNCNKQNVIHK